MVAAVTEPLPCGPAADGHDLPFWEGLTRGVVSLPRCADCGAWRALGRALCAACWSFETSWAEVAMRGSVFTWIRTHRDFMSELDVPAPYVTALVELDEAPVRLLGVVLGDDAEVSIGTRMRGAIRQPDNAAWPVLSWEVDR